jgi:ABC-2 type transport system permease protein
MNLVKAELFKLRTTSLWWVFAIVLVPLYAASLLANWASENSPDGTASTRSASEVAANLYTTGQFFGVLLVLLLSAIIVTNEFFHLTATTTFLVTPRR